MAQRKRYSVCWFNDNSQYVNERISTLPIAKQLAKIIGNENPTWYVTLHDNNVQGKIIARYGLLQMEG